MVKSIKQTISLLLLVVYAFFFASANLFYHSHQDEEGNIVHSHIYWGHKAHSHTTAQLQIIDQLSTLNYENADQIEIQQLLPEYFEGVTACREVAALSQGSEYSFSLRAPPVI